ncbi:unnamed protein product [Brassica oleracea]
MNIDEARELHIRVERRRDPMTGDYFENIGGMLFKDGFIKKGHFMKGDAVIVIKGDLKNLKGWIEKVDEENVLIRSGMKGLPVVSGTHEGATGMVVKVDQHVIIILSDTTKEHVRVFADHVVESSEVTTGVTKIGQYELHDLVLLDNPSFGVFKGNPDRPEVALVKLREIKCKLDRKISVQDRYKNVIAVKDMLE